MWYEHLLPFREVSFSTLSIVVTWPYHRTLRFFTLDPAERLSRQNDLNFDESGLTVAINHWWKAKEEDLEFVSRAV